MRLSSIGSVVAALALVLAASAVRAENNPAYDSWASHQPGTSVTIKSTVSLGGVHTDVTVTYTLKKVDKDKVVVEQKEATTLFGQVVGGKGHNVTIPATHHAPATLPNTDTKTEDVTVDGQTYSCTVTETTVEPKGAKVKTTTKTWTCPQVPNLLVKSEITTEGGKKPKTETLLLSKVDIK